MDERFVKRLMSTLKCSLCSRRYELANINILGHRDDLWFLSVFCPVCHSLGLLAAVIKEGKVPEIATDLTEEEYSKFPHSAAVGADDVLDIHNFLKDFEGDFSRLFSRNEQR